MATSTPIRTVLKTEIIFLRFKKNTFTRSVFESFSPVHTKTLNNGNTIACLTEHASC